MDKEIVINGVVYVRKCCNQQLNCHAKFPACGQQFGIRSTGQDRSHQDSIFECVATDEFKIVAKKIKGYVAGKNNYVFDRGDWMFQPVSACVINSIAD